MSKIEYSADFEKKLEEFIQTKEFKDNECFRIPKVRDLLVLDRFKNIPDIIHASQLHNFLAEEHIQGARFALSFIFKHLRWTDILGRSRLIKWATSRAIIIILDLNLFDLNRCFI